jgi:hypothetical protein
VPSYTARHHALSTSRTARRRCGHGGCTQGHRTKPSTCRLALVPRRRRPLLSKLEAAGGFALFWLKSDASPVETDVRLSAQSSKIHSLNKYSLSFIIRNIFYPLYHVLYFIIQYFSIFYTPRTLNSYLISTIILILLYFIQITSSISFPFQLPSYFISFFVILYPIAQ